MSTAWSIPPASDKAGAPAWPIGLYRCAITGMEAEAENRYSDLPRIRWEFKVTKVISTTDRPRVRELQAEGAQMMGWCNLTMSRKSVMRGWVEAVMGHPLAEGETPGDPRHLIGKEVNINVVQHIKDNGEITTKIGALQPIDDEEEDPEPPPVRRPGPSERVMASAQGMTRTTTAPAPLYNQQGQRVDPRGAVLDDDDDPGF